MRIRYYIVGHCLTLYLVNRDALRELSGLFPETATKKGEAMPKLTSKVTIKLEPGLLDVLQELADSQGLPVSSYIRKAVIEHVGIRQENESSYKLRIETTDLEFRVINRLMKLGYLKRPEDLFHRSFDLYLKQEYENVKICAEREFLDDHILSNGDRSRRKNAFSRSFESEGYSSHEEDEQEEGEM